MCLPSSKTAGIGDTDWTAGLLCQLLRKKLSLGQPLMIMNAASCMMSILLSFGRPKWNVRHPLVKKAWRHCQIS